MYNVVPLATRLLSFSSVTLATRNIFPSMISMNRIISTCPALRYSKEEFGAKYTDDYRVHLSTESGIISPFHDIPIFADEDNSIFNMIVEIPRWSNAKMEISTEEFMNPIKQDIKKGKLRYVKNSFPFKGYIWNYGAIPQTWENPNEIDQHTGEMGDGDPIDIIDIGHNVTEIGVVKQVKALGVLALVDDGETDWKVIAIDVTDPLATKLNDITDLPKVMPGLLEATREWFATYKIPGSDTAPNVFAFDGEAKDRDFTIKIIMETHEQWKRLVYKQIENVNNLSCENVSVDKSPYKISAEEASRVIQESAPFAPPAPLPLDIDVMYYLTDFEKQGG